MEELHYGNGQTLIDTFFTWKEWHNGEGDNFMDIYFTDCVLLMDIRNKYGHLLMAKGDHADHIDWIPKQGVTIRCKNTIITCTLFFHLVAVGIEKPEVF